MLPASSAAIWAAYGVDFLEPLNPFKPAEDQEITFPCSSVIEIIVLLNVELTNAIPEDMFFLV